MPNKSNHEAVDHGRLSRLFGPERLSRLFGDASFTPIAPIAEAEQSLGRGSRPGVKQPEIITMDFAETSKRVAAIERRVVAIMLAKGVDNTKSDGTVAVSTQEDPMTVQRPDFADILKEMNQPALADQHATLWPLAHKHGTLAERKPYLALLAKVETEIASRQAAGNWVQ